MVGGGGATGSIGREDTEMTLSRAYRAAGNLELTANIIFTPCELAFFQGDPDRGVVGLQKVRSLYEQEFLKLAQFGSDSQKLAFLQKHRSKADFVLGVHFEHFPDHQALTEEAFAVVQQRKNLMTSLARMASKVTSDASGGDLENARSKLGLLNLSLGIVDRESADPFARDWMVEMEEAMRAMAIEKRQSEVPPTPNHEQLSEKLHQDEVLSSAAFGCFCPDSFSGGFFEGARGVCSYSWRSSRIQTGFGCAR